MPAVQRRRAFTSARRNGRRRGETRQEARRAPAGVRALASSSALDCRLVGLRRRGPAHGGSHEGRHRTRRPRQLTLLGGRGARQRKAQANDERPHSLEESLQDGSGAGQQVELCSRCSSPRQMTSPLNRGCTKEGRSAVLARPRSQLASHPRSPLGPLAACRASIWPRCRRASSDAAAPCWCPVLGSASRPEPTMAVPLVSTVQTARASTTSRVERCSGWASLPCRPADEVSSFGRPISRRCPDDTLHVSARWRLRRSPSVLSAHA